MRLRNVFRSGPGLVPFYEEVLGLPVRRRGARSADLDLGGASLHLHEDLDAAEQAGFDLPARTQVLSFDVDDLEAVHARLRASGARVRVPPRPAPWGGRILLAEDPAGHLVEFTQP